MQPDPWPQRHHLLMRLNLKYLKYFQIDCPHFAFTTTLWSSRTYDKLLLTCSKSRNLHVSAATLGTAGQNSVSEEEIDLWWNKVRGTFPPGWVMQGENHQFRHILPRILCNCMRRNVLQRLMDPAEDAAADEPTGDVGRISRCHLFKP